MNAYEQIQLDILKEEICEWGEDSDLAKLPELFAEQMIEHAKELLGIET